MKPSSMLKSMAKASPQGVEMSNGDELAKALSAVKLSKEHSLETFPTEVRLQIYRELLLVDDEEYEEIELDELEGLDLHPAILRGNRKIHDEAASVLYGENTFKHTLAGFQHIKLWHSYGCEGKTTLSRRYSRLITKVFLYLDLAGDDNDPSMHAVLDAAATLRSNIDGAARKLALNDLRLLKIRFRNAYTGGPLNYFRGDWYRFGGNPFWGQDCLEPLLKTRATRFEILGAHVGPQLAAKLKATIEGPKGTAFFDLRREKEEDEESEIENFDTYKD